MLKVTLSNNKEAMKHTYTVEGITCMGCVNKVQSVLSDIKGITSVDVSLEGKKATVTMSEHIMTTAMNTELAKAGNYRLTESSAAMTHTDDETANSFFETYKPLLIILAYLVLGVGLNQVLLGGFNWAIAMQMFMGGFFLIFSFFKMLDLQGFALAYSSYDVVTIRWLSYGYIYPFIELGLGIAYVIGVAPLATNILTLVVMSVSIIGVLQSVLNKQKIQCACLGTGFNLPMSTVTIIEDGTMIVMAALMITMHVS